MSESSAGHPRGGGTQAVNSCRRGFTLIELLVVVSIVVILVAVLTPFLARARLLAKRATCLSNLRGLANATGTYQSVFGEYVPICWQNLPPTVPIPWKSWRTCLLPYAGNFASFNCPAATDWGKNCELFHSADEITGQDWEGTANAGSYGIMYQDSLASYKTLNLFDNVDRGNPSWSCAFSSKPGEAWTDPAASVYVADACFTTGQITYPSSSYKGVGTSAIVPPSDPGYSSGSPTRRFSDRHAGTNCLFVDGHVSIFRTQDLDGMKPGTGDCVWDVN
jgi:prepilin-type N-terminal cleavage/methylation domain-containing protein/prepilin-type processing-associated H-X9-DG protein